MQTITLDSATVTKLGAATEQTALCDESGRIIGYFSPSHDKAKPSDHPIHSPIPIEQLRELQKKHRTGKPLEEILKRLGY